MEILLGINKILYCVEDLLLELNGVIFLRFFKFWIFVK